MADVRVVMRDLVREAKAIHLKERAINLESVLVIGKLDRMNTAVNLGLSSADFARAVGLTPSVMWKRAQAARVLWHFPEALAMVKAGETEMTHLALLAPKITEANAKLLLSGIRNKSTREVAGLASRVTADGQLLEQEEEFEFKLRLSKTQVEALDRAREVLSARGHVPTLPEIFEKALADLLTKRDPLRKAQRQQAASARKDEEHKVPADEEVVPNPGESPGVDEGPWVPSSMKRSTRSALPAAEKHAVMLRDQGQCTQVLAGGVRCPERSMLEFDHIQMKCRGGTDTAANLALRCRSHNQGRARGELGEGYLVSWAESRGVAEERLHPLGCDGGLREPAALPARVQTSQASRNGAAPPARF